MTYFPEDNNLLISPDTIKALGVMDMNVDEKALMPVIKFVQDDKIRQLLGDELYVRLLDVVASGQVCEDGFECYRQLLDGYIKFIMAWYVKAESFKDNHLKNRNSGAIMVNDANFRPMSFTEMMNAVIEFKSRATPYTIGLNNYLDSCSNSCFPGLSSCACLGRKGPDKTNVTSVNMWFPNKNNRI